MPSKKGALYLTHIERAARRKRLADRYLAGEEVAKIAGDEGVRMALVLAAMKEHGIEYVPLYNPPLRLYKILALLVNTFLTYREIGMKMGISKARVGEIASNARKAGIKLPVRKIQP